MARISKKQQTPVEVVTDKPFKVGLYARLSIEDSGYDNSNSIEMQIELLRDYLSDRTEFYIVEEYVDNGFTGTNFNRPSFKRMMDDIKGNKINTIIVKDLSRFGRNNIETEEYLDSIFPFLKVRFIAINDSIDSFEKKENNDFLKNSVKNIVNEMYAKDISKKVNATLDMKRKNGEYIGATALYGYKKDPENKNKLIVDEEVADVVKLIFKMRKEGKGYLAIARYLNDNEVLSPNNYLVSKGLRKKLSNGVWQETAIKSITDNEMYIGNMVQGKTQKNMRTNRKSIRTDEWVIVPNTHEAIIDKETFEFVRNLNAQTRINSLKKYGKHGDSVESFLKGKIICGVCGGKMVLSREYKNDKLYEYYYCKVRKRSKSVCDNKRISYKKLNNIVAKAIELEIENLEDEINNVKFTELEEIPRIKAVYELEEKEIKSKIINLQKETNKLLADFTNKKIDDEGFKKLHKEKSDLMLVYSDRLGEIEKCYKRFNRTIKKLNTTEGKVKKLKELFAKKELNRKLIEMIIDKVVVHKNNEIEIIFSHRNPCSMEVCDNE